MILFAGDILYEMAGVSKLNLKIPWGG